MTWRSALALVQKHAPTRSPGRPKGRFDPTLDWEAIENAFVWGETVSQREDGSFERKYPSFRDLGKQFSVSPSLVHYNAKKGNWLARRDKFAGLVKEKLDEKLAESAALQAHDVVAVLDDYIRAFRESLEKKKVRADSVSDLNTAVRLRQFMMGEVEARTEQKTVLSLDALQARHRAMRERAPLVVGVIAGELGPEDGPPIDVEEVPGESGEVPEGSGEVPMGVLGPEAHAGMGKVKGSAGVARKPMKSPVKAKLEGRPAKAKKVKAGKAKAAKPARVATTT